MFMKESMTEKAKQQNIFFETYHTLHHTFPFDKLRFEDYEEAFMEGIRRDNEIIEKTINDPEEPTFENTIAIIRRLYVYERKHDGESETTEYFF